MVSPLRIFALFHECLINHQFPQVTSVSDRFRTIHYLILGLVCIREYDK